MHHATSHWLWVGDDILHGSYWWACNLHVVGKYQNWTLDMKDLKSGPARFFLHSLKYYTYILPGEKNRTRRDILSFHSIFPFYLSIHNNIFTNFIPHLKTYQVMYWKQSQTLIPRRNKGIWLLIPALPSIHLMLQIFWFTAAIIPPSSIGWRWLQSNVPTEHQSGETKTTGILNPGIK